MFFTYLLIGVALTVLLHFALREAARIRRDQPELYRKILATGGGLGLLLLISRIGIGTFNNLVWVLGAVLPFLRKSRPKPSSSTMSRTEAARILGVAENASEAEIHAAWKQLMQRNHPDQGGSEYLASQINQAKDVLLKK